MSDEYSPDMEKNGELGAGEEKQKFKFFAGRRPLSLDEKKSAKIAFGVVIGCLVMVLLHFLYFTIRYTYSDWLCILIYAMLFIAPGYLANAGMLIWGGKGPPLDLGHVCKDGRRLFGEGKTWRGFLLGPIAFAVPISILIHVILYLTWPDIEGAAHAFIADPNVTYDFYATADALIADLKLYILGSSTGEPDMATFLILLPRIILCAFGAAFGDLFGSWAKRRKGLERGAPFWVVDQLDFISGCFLLTLPLLVGNFHFHTFVFLLLFTPSLTVIANTISYFTGHKKVPW